MPLHISMVCRRWNEFNFRSFFVVGRASFFPIFLLSFFYDTVLGIIKPAAPASSEWLAARNSDDRIQCENPARHDFSFVKRREGHDNYFSLSTVHCPASGMWVKQLNRAKNNIYSLWDAVYFCSASRAWPLLCLGSDWIHSAQLGSVPHNLAHVAAVTSYHHCAYPCFHNQMDTFIENMEYAALTFNLFLIKDCLCRKSAPIPV